MREWLKDLAVHVWFPKQAAGTTLEWLEQRFCFIGKETCREFEKQRAIGSK
jgi:hypothetical protein